MKNQKDYDVIVIGGGPGGVPAAIAAAGNGAKVLLVERYGFLGGMATAGLVNPFMSYRAGKVIIVRGLFSELLDRLDSAKALKSDKAHFEAEAMKWVLDEWIADAGVHLKLHTLLTWVTYENGKINQVELSSKSGKSNVSADIFIDSTGDGDLAALAGATYEIGRPADAACQPMTLCFRMANVDTSKLPSRHEINQRYELAKEQGRIDNPRENVLFFSSTNPGVIHFNTTRIIGKYATSNSDLTEAEQIGRQQVRQMVQFLQQEITGFENAYLMKIATQMGIRESRRITGHYRLTEDDVLQARKFRDGIACSSYCIDIHNPTGTGTRIQHVPKGDWYQIPYRCIIPENLNNCLIGSRCISATHSAHSSLRIMPVVAAIGQAAGTAAALCCAQNVAPVQLSAKLLRETLQRQGAFI